MLYKINILMMKIGLHFLLIEEILLIKSWNQGNCLETRVENLFFQIILKMILRHIWYFDRFLKYLFCFGYEKKKKKERKEIKNNFVDNL